MLWKNLFKFFINCCFSLLFPSLFKFNIFELRKSKGWGQNPKSKNLWLWSPLFIIITERRILLGLELPPESAWLSYTTFLVAYSMHPNRWALHLIYSSSMPNFLIIGGLFLGVKAPMPMNFSHVEWGSWSIN